VENLLKETNF